jgi:hypothetical protein
MIRAGSGSAIKCKDPRIRIQYVAELEYSGLKDLSLTAQALLSNYNPGLQLSPAAKQIELDLLRTLPNNKHYESPHSSGPVFFLISKRNLLHRKKKKIFSK